LNLTDFGNKTVFAWLNHSKAWLIACFCQQAHSLFKLSMILCVGERREGGKPPKFCLLSGLLCSVTFNSDKWFQLFLYGKIAWFLSGNQTATAPTQGMITWFWTILPCQLNHNDLLTMAFSTQQTRGTMFSCPAGEKHLGRWTDLFSYSLACFEGVWIVAVISIKRRFVSIPW
jgi:hypothetical protein